MKKLFSILFVGLTAAALAQDPEVDIDSTYFHPAASMYIQGNSAGASNLVTTGLSSFPDNGKLLRLKKLLEQEQQQNQDPQNDDQQDQNQDQNQDQQDQDKNQDQQDQNQDQNQQDPQNDDQQEQDQSQEQQPDQQDPAQPQPPRAEQMSEDEARRLLDAMKQEEENKRLQLHPVMGAPVQVDKDW